MKTIVVGYSARSNAGPMTSSSPLREEEFKASLSINLLLPLFAGLFSAAKSFLPSIASVTLRLLRVTARTLQTRAKSSTPPQP